MRRDLSLGFVAAGLLFGSVMTATRATADVIVNPTYVTTVGYNFLYPSGAIEGVATAGTVGKGTVAGFGFAENRIIASFSLAGLTIDSNTSAHLKPYVSQYNGFTIGSAAVSVAVYGYNSDGTMQVSYGTPVGPALTTLAPVTSIGYLDIDVTSFVKTAYSQNWTNVGFLFVANQSGGGLLFNGGFLGDTPVTQLIIGTVPEPASVGILALGAACLLVRNKRRS